MKPLRVGLLGLAHLHPRSYLPLLAAVEGVAVTAAAEANPALLADFVRDFPVQGFADWRELIAREPLDLAVIFLPHAQCPEAAVACARRGVHLLVEKPMAATAAGVRAIIAAAREAGVVLTTGFAWRYHPVSRLLRDLVAKGALGKLIGAQGVCTAGRKDRYLAAQAGWMLRRAESGGGPMHNLGVHWIDWYRWLLGEEVVEVMGRTVQVPGEHDIEDQALALLTFAGGAVVSLDISYTLPPCYPISRYLRLALRGTAGVACWEPSYEGLHEQLVVASDHPDYAPAGYRELTVDLPPAPGYFGQPGQEYLRDIVTAIREGRRPPITGEDGLRALQVVEAIYESAATGRAVTVPAPDQEEA